MGDESSYRMGKQNPKSRKQFFCFTQGRAKKTPTKQCSSLQPLWCFHHPKKISQKANTLYVYLDYELWFAPKV